MRRRQTTALTGERMHRMRTPSRFPERTATLAKGGGDIDGLNKAMR